jgi:DNA polymerase-4
LELLEADPKKYREVNRRINKIFYDYTDQVEGYSIDESFLQIPNSKFQILLRIATDIKRRIKQEVGEWLTCSVGIGENKFLAKLASDMDKPDGLTVLWRDHLPEIYKNLRLTDLWGVGRGWEKRLSAIGIFSPGQLLTYPVQNLISLFGKPGFQLWQRVNGLEQDVIASVTKQSLTETVWDSPSLSPKMVSYPQAGENKSEEDQSKSFGHSWVLNFRTNNKKFLQPVILHLAEKAARRMRKKGYMSGGLYLNIFCADGKIFSQSKKIHFFINTGGQFYDQAMLLWRGWEFSSDVTKIALGFIYLKKYTYQLNIFSNREQRLINALDSVNDKHGEFSIRSGALINNKLYSPDAIAFGK